MNESFFARDAFFLGVGRSALGRPWRDRLDASGQARALAIAQLCGHGDILARVLSGRGVGPAASEAYLDPRVRDLMPDPYCMMAMDVAAETIAAAIERGDSIAIFGDYDVDGAASAALLADYFAACGLSPIVHIPDRIFEGYGPNIAAIRNFAAAGAKLLIAVDCGSTSTAPMAEARRLGMAAVVLDHHQTDEILPDAIVVNPNRQDDASQLGHLCAAGVVFMTLAAVNRVLRDRGFFVARPSPDLLAGLDLVALATIADVAALTGLNRAFVTQGLAVMRRRGRPGLAALLDVAKAAGPPNPYQMGFLIGPRINAGGRIGDAALGARLFGTADAGKAQRIAEELDRLNRDRQAVERATLAEAESQTQTDDGAVIVAAAEGWHPGIIGLIAARLKERFRRPALVIALPDGEGLATGSGRSIPGVDLGAAIRAAVAAGIVVKGGGHAMAVGVTIDPLRLEDFRAFLQQTLSAVVAERCAEPTLLIDAALTAAAATPSLLEALERAGPFGAGNPEPVFVLPAHRLIDVAVVGDGHLRLRAQSGDGAKIDGIAFRACGQPLERALREGRGQIIHLAGTLSLDRWGGSARVRLRLLDIAPATGRRIS